MVPHVEHHVILLHALAFSTCTPLFSTTCSVHLVLVLSTWTPVPVRLIPDFLTASCPDSVSSALHFHAVRVSRSTRMIRYSKVKVLADNAGWHSAAYLVLKAHKQE